MSRAPCIAILMGVASAAPASGCELDGINHGIFGAWGSGARLHVLVKQQEEEPPPAPEAAPAETPIRASEPPSVDGKTTTGVAATTRSAATPPAPRPNFAAWARPRLSAPRTAEPPPSWVGGDAASSSSAVSSERPLER